MLEEAAPGHVALVRRLLIDVLTPEQLTAIADGLGEAGRRIQDSEAGRRIQDSEAGSAVR